MSNLKIKSSVGDALDQDSELPSSIIDGILWERQAVMFLGSEKAGKSIATLQMLVSIVSNTAFLDKFEIKQSGPVVFIQAEGDESEFKNRLRRMNEACDFDKSLFLHLYKKFIPLEIAEYREAIFATVDEQVKLWGRNPLAIAFDSIYKMCGADLSDNKAARAFTNILDLFIERYKCAIIFIHHESKEPINLETGAPIDRGDKGTFGSVFFRAYADHILFLKKGRHNLRRFSCDTERSGALVFEPLELTLIEPSPLRFIIGNGTTPSLAIIREWIGNRPGHSIDEIALATGFHRNTVSPAVHYLLKQGKLQTRGKLPCKFYPKT